MHVFGTRILGTRAAAASACAAWAACPARASTGLHMGGGARPTAFPPGKRRAARRPPHS